MKLASHLQQGKVRYFLNNSFPLSVVESSHYIWLNFKQTTQSIMLKRKPHLLTLPHQYFMMLPLLYIVPKHIVEFGLGGGNSLRFLSCYSPNSIVESVEPNTAVIRCFHQFFNPNNAQYFITQQTALQWLSSHKVSTIDWLIYDIFSADESPIQELQQLENIIVRLNKESWLTLNISNLSEVEINHILQKIALLKQSHTLIHFQVPYYKNVIVHLHPKVIAKSSNAHIPPYYVTKAHKLWQHRGLNR